MSLINLWQELESVYDSTNRIALLKKYGHEKTRNILIAIYLVAGIIALYFAPSHFLASVAAVFVLAAFITFVFSRLIYKHHPKLSGARFLDKSTYVRYLEFKYIYINNKLLSECNIINLVQWEENRNTSLHSINILTNPLFLVILSAILSQLVEQFVSGENWLAVILILIYLLTVALFIVWLIHDSLHFNTQKKFEIVRFLKWMEIEETSKFKT